MRGLLAITVLVLLTGCTSADAVQPRERHVLEAREAVYVPPIPDEGISGDLSAAEEPPQPDTPDEAETRLETDENAAYVDFNEAYAVPDYGPNELEAAYGGGADDFRTRGVVYDDGTRYTWYSEAVLPGCGLNELNANGRALDESGYVVDGDGYIAVASSDHEIGTVLDTPFGEARVYDTGCPSGTVDVYTGWR